MTRYIILILTIFILSCNNQTTNSPQTEINSNDTIIPFNGIWVSEKYINTLTKTKSPRLSQDSGHFFHVPKSYKERAYPFVYHEGGADFHIFKHGESFYLKADYGNSDSMQIVFSDNGRQMNVLDQTYIKSKENIGIPENILFKGVYLCKNKSVTLHENGEINGLDSIKNYEVINDYIGPGMADLDLIMMGTNKEKMSWYCFEFKADTLFIYNTDCKVQDERGACLDILKGKMLYKMVKK